MFSDINISQGSVATRLRCDGILSYHFAANLSLSLTVKEFYKSVKIVTAMSLVAYFLEPDPRWEFTTFSVLQCFGWRQEKHLGCVPIIPKGLF